MAEGVGSKRRGSLVKPLDPVKYSAFYYDIANGIAEKFILHFMFYLWVSTDCNSIFIHEGVDVIALSSTYAKCFLRNPAVIDFKVTCMH